MFRIFGSLGNLTGIPVALLVMRLKVSTWSYNLSYQSRRFDTSRDLIIRCLIWYWNRTRYILMEPRILDLNELHCSGIVTEWHYILYITWTLQFDLVYPFSLSSLYMVMNFYGYNGIVPKLGATGSNSNGDPWTAVMSYRSILIEIYTWISPI